MLNDFIKSLNVVNKVQQKSSSVLLNAKLSPSNVNVSLKRKSDASLPSSKNLV